VDFLSWHAFYFDPARYYGVVVPYMRDAFAQAGYPRTTPVIATEWNIAPVPPYAEGDINATQVDAAYVAASLIAMNETGVNGQAFQMYMDPGVDGYYGGMMTNAGIARANFRAFTMFASLRGRQVSVKTGDPWVKATAFVDGNNKAAYVLVASYVPTRNMITQTETLAGFLANRDLEQQIVDANEVDALLGGQLPDPYASALLSVQQATQARIETAVALASQRTQATIQLTVSGLAGFTPANVTRFLVDSTHGNVFPDLAAANGLLVSSMTPPEGEDAHLTGILTNSGMTSAECAVLAPAIEAGTTADQILSQFPLDRRNAVTLALQNVVNDVQQRYVYGLTQVEAMPSSRMDVARSSWPASGQLSVTTEPNSIQLFVLTP
jgi:hypothetical protein